MTEENKSGLTAEERQNIKLANLKPLNNRDDLSPEEKQRQHEIRVAGGKARAEQRRLHRSLKDIANDLLDMTISKEQAKKVIGEFADDIPAEELTNGVLLMAKMIREATENGTAKAAEFVRDTSGQKPKDEIAITAETMTDADRALMANIAERLNINKPD